MHPRYGSQVMSGGVSDPVVFLDIDGPLIPLRARPLRHEPGHHRAAARASDERGNPLLDRLDPNDGLRLLALDCQLVWATSWMAEANEVISPLLGLPDLDVVEWPDVDEQLEPGLHWKTVALTRWADQRPFVWLDDEIADVDRRWVAAHHSRRALLHRVDPGVGLTDADFAAVRRWLTATDRSA
jgi:hypothetical protein